MDKMATDESQSTPLERLAANTMQSLQNLGLFRLACSSTLRALAKKLIIWADCDPHVRAISPGLGKSLKLRVMPKTPKSRMGTYEPSLQALIHKEIKLGITVYDCRANVGFSSVIFARLVGLQGRVSAFEPSPWSLQCLRVASPLNSLSNLTAVPEAVSDENAMFRFSASAPEGSLISDHIEGVFGISAERGRFLHVPTISPDEFVYVKRNSSTRFHQDRCGSCGRKGLAACPPPIVRTPSAFVAVY